MDISSVAYERRDSTVVYTSFPGIHELRCIMCQTDFIEVQDSSSKSNFHWQTMKCRLLIHVFSDIIASPVSGTEKFIFVITHRKFFETGKLESILRRFNLVYQGVRPITTELYKNCLIFTIQTKIAPLWNKVGQYFLQGKEFYNSVEPVKALKLDVLVEEKNVSLQLHTEKIKIPYIKLEDYVPSFVLSKFLADPEGYIDLSRYSVPFVSVLPSIKRGKLVSISKKIPVRCPFKDYDQLRRHWKNMYGYSLPRNQTQIVYYEIKFLIPKSKVFTYPNLCIASGPLDIIPNRDKEFTVTHFLSDMLVKLPIICGRHLQVSRHAPINTQTSNVNLATNVLRQCEEQNTHLTNRNNPNLQSSSFEFSKHRNINSTSVKAQLSKIHQIHNTSFYENITDHQNIQENRNIQFLDDTEISITQNNGKVCIETVTNNADGKLTVPTQETISQYFKIKKPRSIVKDTEPAEEEMQTHLTLKEKLLQAKSTNNSTVSVQDKIENTNPRPVDNITYALRTRQTPVPDEPRINIEELAQKSQLHQVKKGDLSNWLKKHSIPHCSKARKVELINKVLSHIRNTQVLQQFRM